jgi:hypothetical protein
MPSTRVTSTTKTTPTRITTRYHYDHSVSKKDSTSRFSAHWDSWYDAFVAEVKDEFPTYTSTQLRQEAESRWTTFAAKSLKTSEGSIRAWLGSASPRSITY